MAKQRRRPVRRRDRKGGPTSGRRRPARTAATRSTRSTTRICPRCGGSSPIAARSARGGSPVPADGTRARSRALSSARASSPCCRTCRGRSSTGRARRTVRPRPRPRPLAGGLDATRDPAAGRRVARRARDGRRRVGRLPAQLPAAPQARRAGHGGVDRGRHAARGEAAERAQHEAEERARDSAALLGRTVLTIPQQAGDDGRLFGSVTTQDIADAIRDARGHPRRQAQDPPRRADPERRYLHGRRRGRRRGDRGGQDDGRRRLAAAFRAGGEVCAPAQERGSGGCRGADGPTCAGPQPRPPAQVLASCERPWPPGVLFAPGRARREDGRASSSGRPCEFVRSKRPRTALGGWAAPPSTPHTQTLASSGNERVTDAARKPRLDLP